MNVLIDGVEYVPFVRLPTDNTLLAALDARFTTREDETITIRDYLCNLLSTLWKEKERFSGKRPFGNSGWECDLYAALVSNGFIFGELDEDGYLDYVDEESADKFVHELIMVCFYGLAKSNE